MNIETVIANINNTIAGKEQLKNKMHALSRSSTDPVAQAGLDAIVECVNLNLQELNAIKSDLERCVNEE